MEGKEGGRGLRRSLQGILVGAAAAAVALALWLPGILDVFEAKTWDLRARLLARPGSATSQVVTILLDQYSLDWASKQGVNWPWPRSLYAMIADFCRAGGAKALVVDVLYTEETNEDVGQDEELARGFADNGKVVAALNLATKKGQGSAQAWPADVPRPGITVAAGDPRRLTGLTFPYAQFPIAAVSKSARFLANTNLPADPSDGVYRREPLFSLFDGIVLPSEALGAWAVAQSDPVELTLGRGTVSARAGAAVVTAPVDEDGQAILRYRGPTLKHDHYTAASVLNSAQQMLEGSKPELSPEVFRNKYVFFGFTAPGLFDLKPTPMAGSYPGVEVNATMLDNLISGDFMRPVPLVASLVLLLLLCLGPGIAVSRVSGVGATALVYAIALPIAPALAVGAYAIGYWLPVVALELGAAFSLVGASLASYATEGRQRRYLKGAFRQYLSPVVIDELIAHPERLKLGGEKRELTIFFSDIQGFTTISEALGAEALTRLLNEYLSAMGDIIQEEGGTIDKYIGDAIVAFWNAPVDQGDHALRGTRAALRCQSRLAEIRPSLKERYGKDVYARIGLNTGPVTVGNMGSSTRFNYTMLGDAANLASRLEGINKYFHTYFMASASVIERLGGAYPARELSRVAVVGRREPVTVYEPMLPEHHAQRRPTLEIFHRGLQEFYAGRFPEARRIFAEIAGQDPPAGAYELKCAELTEHPPAGAWNGVWVMTEK